MMDRAAILAELAEFEPHIAQRREELRVDERRLRKLRSQLATLDLKPLIDIANGVQHCLNGRRGTLVKIRRGLGTVMFGGGAIKDVPVAELAPSAGTAMFVALKAVQP